MSIIVYRKGDSHIENGIKCEAVSIEPSQLKRYRKAGWELRPERVAGFFGIFKRKAKFPGEE